MESDWRFVAVDDGRGAAGGRGGSGGGERKRRFTEEQVRLLETTFHSRRAKALEPREKEELARELGLQPRQVAIWFQNKRARWRSKQLEQDLVDLRAHSDALRARVESLEQEKLGLAAQLEKLRERLRLSERQQDVSCVDEDGSAEADDRRVHSASCVVSEDSAADCYDPLAYGASFCTTPDLWAETWPPVEWNAVA